MLARAVLDRALAVLDRRILLRHAGDAGEARSLLQCPVDQIIVPLVAQRHVVVVDVAMHAEAAVELCALGIGEGAIRPPAVGIDPATGVAHRHPGLAVIDFARHRRRREGVVGHQKLRNAPIELGTVGLARATDHQAGIMADDAEFRPRVVADPTHAIVGFRLIAQRRRLGIDRQRFLLVLGQHSMQEREMRGIDAALQALHPVAVLPLLGDVALCRRHESHLELRQLGNSIARPHVDPDHVGPFAHRIGQQLDRVLVGRFWRRCREIDAVAVDVELPAMEGTAQATFLVAAVIETSAAMRAVRFDDADATVAVAERQQVLAQDLDLLRRPVALRQFGR